MTVCPACGENNRDGALCCSMCQAVLRRASEAAPSTRVDYAAVARQRADPARDPMLASFGATLDFSTASVVVLDAFFDEMWGPDGDARGRVDHAPSQSKLNLALGFGAYLGEVARRLTQGRWQDDPARPDQPLAASVVVAGSLLSPFAAVLTRFRDGNARPLRAFVDDARAAARRPADAREAREHEEHARALLTRSSLPVETRAAVALALLRAARAADPSSGPRLSPQIAALEAEAIAAPAPIAAPTSPTPVAAPVSPMPVARHHDEVARALGMLRAGRLDEALAAATAFARLEKPLALASMQGAGVEPGGVEAQCLGALLSLGRGMTVPSLRALATQAHRLGSPAGVLAAFERAASVAPADPEVLSPLGVARFRAGRLDDALAAFTAALAAAPSRVESLEGRVAVLLRLERPDEAAPDAARLTELDPERAEAWALRAEVDERRGLAEEAVGFAQHALSLPGPPSVHAVQRARVARLGALLGLSGRR
jgi:tetratricopeptide (TPR) repeat protein